MLPGSLAAIFGGGARAEEHRGWRERGERRVEEWRERAGAPHRAEVAGHDGRRYLPWAVIVVAALIGLSLLARRHKAQQAASRAREAAPVGTQKPTATEQPPPGAQPPPQAQTPPQEPQPPTTAPAPPEPAHPQAERDT